MPESEERTDFLSVFRTGKVWELDLARDALNKHQIPYFTRTESMSGIMTALDVMPTTGPGVFWSLLVPRETADKAREILRVCRLNVEKEPEIWGFAPESKVKKYWKMYIWGVLILTALLFVAELFLRNR
jgi:hypothetical protein